MDIKLILENQLAIMRWIVEVRDGSKLPALNQQIEKTKERIEQFKTVEDRYKNHWGITGGVQS